MYAKLFAMWFVLNGVINATAYTMFSWWNFNAILLLSIASGIVSGIAIMFARMRGGAVNGGGNARASTQSKGARGRDR